MSPQGPRPSPRWAQTGRTLICTAQSSRPFRGRSHTGHSSSSRPTLARGSAFIAPSAQLGGRLVLVRRALLIAVAQMPLLGAAMAQATTETDTARDEAPGTDE